MSPLADRPADRIADLEVKQPSNVGSEYRFEQFRTLQQDCLRIGEHDGTILAFQLVEESSPFQELFRLPVS